MTASPLPRWGDQGDGRFVNPIIPADYSDLDAIRVGDTYYAISSTLHTSPAMVILRSTDMVNWTTIGHAVSDLAELGEDSLTWRKMAGYGRGMWAGAIRHHAGRFYIYFASPVSGLYVTTSERAEGPWTPPRSLLREQGHDDPCPFWDTDGSAWLAMTRFGADPVTGKHYVITLYRMSPDGMHLDVASGIPIQNSQGSEASKLYRFGKLYYHYFSEVRPEGRVPMMKRATSLPGLADAVAVQLGHVDAPVDREPNQGALLQAPGGDWWFLTHQGHGDWEGRAMCLLPVTWRNGWPIIGRPGPDGIGNMVWDSRKPNPSKRPPLPDLSDDFSGGIKPIWEWNHAPRHDAFSLKERPGWLRLKAFPPAFKGLRGVGNMLSQRSWRTADNRAAVLLDLTGMVDGQTAGLCHLSADGAWIGVRQLAGRRILCCARGEVVEDGPVIATPLIRLATRWGNDGRAIFEHDDGHGRFQRFGGTYDLQWRDYRGDRVGLFTYHDNEMRGHVDVSDFRYRIASQNA
ncbi:glycoside hydrolase family 43 protein [Sphingomonas fuzhouensis]|uniref:glycoside hydrolase family 43 protein n=1 Tax=Sphingomonas fuzhouensis TaxID=3106033 RepID=UPI002AFF4E4A|nr:family 43 glycosylhydrolase [Sphingomonas sp. SGZ-02]